MPRLRPKELAVFFNKKQTANIPPEILPPPYLTRVENLIFRQEGALTSRKSFTKIDGIPSMDDVPIKVLTYKDHLMVIGEKGIYSYDEEQKNFNQITSRRVMSIRTIPVSQRESDIQFPSEAVWNQDVYIFYLFNNQVYYKRFNITNNRIMEAEVSLEITGLTSKINGVSCHVETLSNGTTKQIWIGVSTADELKFVALVPNKTAPGSAFTHNEAGIQRFTIRGNKVFYIDSSGALQNVVYDPDGLPPTSDPTSIFNAEDHAISFEGRTLWDFYQFTEFNYSSERFKLLWSLQTGFFILNSLNQIVGHLKRQLCTI